MGREPGEALMYSTSLVMRGEGREDHSGEAIRTRSWEEGGHEGQLALLYRERLPWVYESAAMARKGGGNRKGALG